MDKENVRGRRRNRGVYRRGGEEYSSEPDLTTAEKRIWNSGFPPGFTVDELRHHRRRRAPGSSKPGDHIQLETGTFNQLKSEYRRSYKNPFGSDGELDSKDVSPVRGQKPEDTFLLEGSQTFSPEYRESFPEYPIEQGTTRRRKRSAFRLIDDLDMALYSEELRRLNNTVKSEKQSQFKRYENFDRTIPLRRPTTLKLEGDILSKTEKAEQFIEYLITKRRSLIINSPNLKLGVGDMEKKTEMMEQFGPLDYQARPPLCKKLTNLHLEGEMDILTESNEQFVHYDYEERPPLIKRSTNLHLEGDLELKPEYRHSFVELKGERRSPSLPQHNLKIDGFFDGVTENKKFMGHEGHPPIPFLRGSDFNRKLLLGEDKVVKHPEYREKYIQHNVERASAVKRGAGLKPEGEFDGITESREYMERPFAQMEKHQAGGIDLNPEYKNAYVDFYKGGNVVSPGRRRRTYSQATNLKNEGSMEMYPEYKRSFVDFPRQRPTLIKPEGNLSSEGDVDHMTEKRSQYIEHDLYRKSDSLKRENELRLDGKFECQPEYRKAYIDYLIREKVDRKQRPIDNLGPQRRAFEVLTSTDSKNNSTTSTAKSETPTTESGNLLTVPKPAVPVSIIKKPPVSTTESDTDRNRSSDSSAIPRPKLAHYRRKSIGTLESKLFGPKVTIKTSSTSSKPTSRSPSPLPPKPRTRSLGRKSPCKPKEEKHFNKTGARFGNTIRVEDLAYTPSTSPISTRKVYTNTRKKWNKERPESLAFYVLEDDINNNICDSESNMLQNPLLREQKWMPSWYSP